MAYNAALQNGIVEMPASGGGTSSAAGVAEAVAAINGYKKTTGAEVVLYQKVSMGTGSHAGNPWLQELPDPVSKATWDNYAMISMTMAEKLGIKLDTDYTYYPQKPTLEITVGKNKITIPALVFPGINADTIAIAVGYGRNEALGVTASGVGVNVYPLATFNGTTVDNVAAGATVTNLKKSYKIAQTQKYNSYENRKEVLRETTLASFKKYPEVIPAFSEELKDAFYKNSNNDFRNATRTRKKISRGLNGE
jgi:molybdopterin-containing oxidoreductase family iron-sulfur binding subunit